MCIRDSYQPKYGLSDNQIAGAEALVRWKHPERGMISPGEFIPVFERNGFITKLDYYVWEQTCIQLRKWMDEGKNPLPISVNLSRVSLYNKDIVNVICNLVDSYRIPRRLFPVSYTHLDVYKRQSRDLPLWTLLTLQPASGTAKS